MAIQPGDLLHGDENGLLVVPADQQEKLPDAVNHVRSRNER
jgi:regulator of RNase E activity RraA